jgi:hypothetical protein
VGILDIFKKKPVAAESRRPVAPPVRRSQPAADYGANPYDTYTWELHTDLEDGERELKRAHRIDKPKSDGESFNPYDTGKFSGGW